MDALYWGGAQRQIPAVEMVDRSSVVS